MKTQNVVVDVGRMNASDLYFVQGEKGREITFKVMNSFLEDFVNLAGYTATIHILKSDGNFTIDTMTIDSSKSECYYTLTENDCACGGRGFYDLSFSKNDELIYTAHGDFVGDFRTINDDTVNSVSTAYGVTFPEGFQEKLIAGDKIHINGNVISAEGEIYTAGDNINISENNVISATDTKYTAGDNININESNVISATDTKYTAGNGININANNVISASSVFDKTLLYQGSDTAGSLQSHIQLSEEWDNFDMLEIICFYGGGLGSLYSDYVSTDALSYVCDERGYDYACALASYANTSCACYHLNANHKDMDLFGTNTLSIYQINGIKF